MRIFITSSLQVIKSRMMRWTRHVERMGQMRSAYKIFGGKLKGKDYGKVRVEGRIILEWILNKYGGNAWTGFIWLRIGTCGGRLWTQ
jgi:hypothetical protein